MKVPTRPFGPTSREVPIIGQGTWRMEEDDPDLVIAALRRGIELGLKHIDTAEMYGDGSVESMLAEVVGRGREELFLVSKVLPSHASRRGTIAACERSLSRLGTDYLDCYLLHWRGGYPLEETFAAFEDLVSAGKIRSWGVSNFDVGDLQEALEVAGEGRIACNQVLYHLQARHIEAELLPFCKEHGIAVTAYSPFGSGRFPSPRSAGGRVLEEIARRHGATPRQVALAFLVRDPDVFIIPKAAKPEHVEENAGAARVKLSARDLRELDAAFPLVVQPELPIL